MTVYNKKRCNADQLNVICYELQFSRVVVVKEENEGAKPQKSPHPSL